MVDWTLLSVEASIIDGNHFQIYKTIAVVASFTVAAILQRLFPATERRSGKTQAWRINFSLAAINVAAVSIICGGCACALSGYVAERGFGLFNRVTLPTVVAIALSVLALDLTAWAWHLANHRIPFLWRFHAVHHSDAVYDTTTAVRFHTGEVLISLIVRLGVVAALGLPVADVLAFEMVYAFFNFLDHGSIAVPSKLSQVLGGVFITPALHRLHHSRHEKHHNANFGTIFSLWDRIAGTKLPEKPATEYSVGLDGATPWSSTLIGVLQQPLG